MGFGLFMVTLGGMSAWDLITQPSFSAALKAKAAIPAWPAASGRLVELRIQRDLSGSDSKNWHPSAVKYHYSVADRAYSGDRFDRSSFGSGDRVYDAPSVEEVETNLARLFPLPSGKRQGPTEETARMSHLRYSGQESVYRYDLDVPVKVFYDPEQPGVSFLDNTDLERPLTRLDYTGAPFFLAYLLGGMGLLVVIFALTPWLGNLHGTFGRTTVSPDGLLYRYEHFGLLHSIAARYLGILFLMVAYGLWHNSFEGKTVAAGTAILEWLGIACFAALGLVFTFLRGGTILDLAARVVIGEVRISLILFSIPVRRTRKALSEFVGLRVRMTAVSQLPRIPAHSICDVSLLPKAGKPMILFTAKLPPGQKQPPAQVLELVERLKQQTGLECLASEDPRLA